MYTVKITFTYKNIFLPVHAMWLLTACIHPQIIFKQLLIWHMLKEQYRYLHHALVHTLTLPWEPVKIDNFPQYMKQNKGTNLREQFKVLLQPLLA